MNSTASACRAGMTRTLPTGGADRRLGGQSRRQAGRFPASCVRVLTPDRARNAVPPGEGATGARRRGRPLRDRSQGGGRRWRGNSTPAGGSPSRRTAARPRAELGAPRIRIRRHRGRTHADPAPAGIAADRVLAMLAGPHGAPGRSRSVTIGRIPKHNALVRFWQASAPTNPSRKTDDP